MACLADNDATIALDPNEPLLIQVTALNLTSFCTTFVNYDRVVWLLRSLERTVRKSSSQLQVLHLCLIPMQTKPHGHGDVHAVLHSSGLLPEW